jgi:hypothetical protein
MFSMTDDQDRAPRPTLEEALKSHPDPDLKDQGEIAADDAGATALAERVTGSTGVQGEDEDQDET